ncbi:hypothetical protein RvY_16666 [Ramazzottius varieornatus]|uniref:Uncharacterized protein n=1 Tax=Ramazzottius varieornatus TaxID=947166 RepID=A0A1D1VZB3_RAMVA|nr:hypothetical protein RvY_16666 [Ramazzottius varieornatus]
MSEPPSKKLAISSAQSMACVEPVFMVIDEGATSPAPQLLRSLRTRALVFGETTAISTTYSEIMREYNNGALQVQRLMLIIGASFTVDTRFGSFTTVLPIETTNALIKSLQSSGDVLTARV